MRIPERVVAEVVAEASIKMSDPNYTQVLVGGWVQQQPAAAKYVSAHVRELGGAEGVINTVFHAALLAMCFQRHGGRSVRAMTYAELDRVSEGDREAALKKCQPALFDYLAANVENAEMKKILTLFALGMDYVF
jgi:hypothetical protein